MMEEPCGGGGCLCVCVCVCVCVCPGVGLWNEGKKETETWKDTGTLATK